MESVWHVICAFRQGSKVLAGATADQLGVSSGLGNIKPFRVWLGGDHDWQDRPGVRFVFLTVRQSKDGGPSTSGPVGEDEAESAKTRLLRYFQTWEGMESAIVYIEHDDKFTERLWRDDERTKKILRAICLMRISWGFPDWLDIDPEPEPEPEQDPEPAPEPETKPKRPDWPGIERPSRF